MRISTLVFSVALALTGSALAQNSGVQTGASSQSSASVSAGRDGAAAQHEGSAAAGVHSEHANAGAAQGGEMNATLTKPVDARRAKPGDEVTATLAQDAHGSGDVMFRRGTKLVGHVTEAQPHGRKSDSASASGTGSAESRLGIVFDKAILEGGREVPVNATIQAIAAGEAAASGGAHGVEGAAGGSAFGSGRATGGGLVGGANSTVGGALGGAANVGAGLGGAASSIGSATRGSAGAVGGLNGAGRLMSGSHGVFGMSGVDFASAAAGSAQGSSVLTSKTGNVELERGTQLLLTGQAAGGAQGAGHAVTGSGAGAAAGAAGNAQGAAGGAAGGASAAGSAAGSASGGASTKR
jgi:hypothetical protein